jgi:hypothetical protein
MKRIFLRSKVLLLSIPVMLLMMLAIGCGSPEATPETTPETVPSVIDTTTNPTDTIPVDSGAGGKPPVPIRN